MENIKIRIPNQDVSRKVQEKVFKLGIRWGSGSSDVRIYDYIDYITIVDNDMYYGDNKSSFDLNKGTEVTWEDFLYKDVDINNCKINLFNINEPSEYNNLSAKLISLGIQSYGNNPLLPPFDCNFEGIYIKDGKTTVVGTKLYYNSISLPELSVDYILGNYKQKEMEVLPEKWCIKVTTENKSFLQDLSNYEIGFCKNHNYSIGGYYGPTGGSWNLRGRTEITFDQFKRLVLKQDIQQNQNMNEIELKCIKTPSKAKNITKNSTYIGIYIDEEETQVDTYDEAVYFLCENDRGTQARYNIDLFEKPVVVKPIITLETLLNYLIFTDTSIKFKDGEYELILVNSDDTHLLRATQSPNSCGIYLIGSQGSEGGVNNLYHEIYNTIIYGEWNELRELYEIQGGTNETIFTIFSEYIKWKISTLSGVFFILSDNEHSRAVDLLDKMDCLKTDYAVNPNSGNNIKMWIFSTDVIDENEDDYLGF